LSDLNISISCSDGNVFSLSFHLTRPSLAVVCPAQPQVQNPTQLLTVILLFPQNAAYFIEPNRESFMPTSTSCILH